MTYFRTCVGCSTPRGSCQTLDILKSHISGAGITSVKHRCLVRTTEFQPGDAVWVELYADGPDDDDGFKPNALFPGVVLEQVGTKVKAFVRPGDPDMTTNYEFTARANGYVSAPLARVRRRAAPKTDLVRCDHCGGVPALSGRCDREDDVAWMIKEGFITDRTCLKRKQEG